MPALLDPSVHRECDAVIEHLIALLDGEDGEWPDDLDGDDRIQEPEISLHTES